MARVRACNSNTRLVEPPSLKPVILLFSFSSLFLVPCYNSNFVFPCFFLLYCCCVCWYVAEGCTCWLALLYPAVCTGHCWKLAEGWCNTPVDWHYTVTLILMRYMTFIDLLSISCRRRVRDFVKPTRVCSVSLSAVSWSRGRGGMAVNEYMHTSLKEASFPYYCVFTVHASGFMVSTFIHWALKNTKSGLCRQTGSLFWKCSLS